MLGIVGLVVSFAVLIFLMFRRYSAVIAALVASVILGLFNGLDFWTILSDCYLVSMVGFVKSWFLIFTLGAVFSEFLTRTGSVTAIAYKLLDVFGKDKAILVVGLISALLTLGGVNPYVQIFIIWPICVVFSRETDTHRGIWLAAYYLGMLCVYPFPGNPGVCNVMVSSGLQVSGASQPLLAVFLTVFYFASGYLYLRWREASWRKKGMGYVPTQKDEDMPAFERESCPNFIVALVPMVAVVALYAALTSSFVDIGLSGVNAVLVAMAVSTILCILLHLKTIKGQIKDALVKSSTGGINPTIVAALITGYLGVVMATPAYSLLVENIQSLSGGPFIQAFVACSVLSSITGAGGTVAVTPVLDTFKAGWLSAGANAGALRPIMDVSCAGTSILPHSGGLNGVLDFTGSSLKESYGPIFWAVFVNALITGLVGAIIATIAL